MGALAYLWTTVKILACVLMIVILLSLILDNLVREIQNLMLEKAKRKAMEKLINASQQERQEYLDFINTFRKVQNEMTNKEKEE